MLFVLFLLFFVVLIACLVFSFVYFLVLYVLLSILCFLCFCIVKCNVSSHVHNCFFSICVHVCGPLPLCGNPTAVNTYHLYNQNDFCEYEAVTVMAL